MPKNKKLLKLLQEPGVKALVQRVELDVLADRKLPAREQKLRHLEEELYFVLDERGHSVHLTDQGVESMSPQDPDLFLVPDISHAVHEIEHDQDLSAQQKIERRRAVEAEYALKSETLHIIHKLLQAHALYEKDVDYVVQEGKVLIVDEFTGRLMHGRRWSEGLHQAVEAKEGVAVQEESQTLATITIQNYFRMYDKLAGMTGTAETEETEFFQIYGLEVVVIPTNRPVRRVDKHDLIYKTRREKYNAILDEVERQHERGLPVLVGTVNVDVSETLSRMLKRRGFRHEVLNAKYHQREAEIVAQAGQPGAITIATNMAGRGTDIKLGPGVKKCQVCGITAHEAPFGQQIERPDLPAEEIKRLGCNDDPPCGLVIIGTERHEARRIDRQLRGRAASDGRAGRRRARRRIDRRYEGCLPVGPRSDRDRVPAQVPGLSPRRHRRRQNPEPRRAGAGGTAGRPRGLPGETRSFQRDRSQSRCHEHRRAGAVARHAGGDRREMERPSLRSRPAESGDPLSTVGPEGPAHRIQAGRLRNVRRPDARDRKSVV